MFGDITVRAQAEIIADPRKLLAEIDALVHRRPQNLSEHLNIMSDVRGLVKDAVQTEYVQANVDALELSLGESEVLDYVNDKLRTALGERLVRVVGPIVTTTRDE